MSGFGFQSLYKDGVTKGQKLLPGFGFVATSILSPTQACNSELSGVHGKERQILPNAHPRTKCLASDAYDTRGASGLPLELFL